MFKKIVVAAIVALVAQTESAEAVQIRTNAQKHSQKVYRVT